MRNTQKTVFALAVALSAVSFAGCGSSDKAATPATPATTSATGATQSVVPTAATGPSANSQPTEPAATNPNSPGAGDEEAARTGVIVGLKNGQFTKATARKVHVAAFIAIELDITVADGQTYNLVITGGDGKQRLVTYNKPGAYRQTIDGLRPNKSASVVLGGDQAIKITADANPGP